MKYYDAKVSKVFKGRSFYFMIALCLIAIGVAAWMAFDRIDSENTPQDMNTTENVSSAPSVPDVSEEEIPSADNAGTDASEPYEGTEKAPSEEAPTTPPAANNFVMPLNGNVLKQFSGDTLVYSNTYKDMRLHTGIDIVGNTGDTVRACGNGVVVSIIDDTKLGKYITVDHGNNIVARYCGLDKISIEEGDTVDATTNLGTLGTVNDECLDASHLHLEFYKDEQPVDPLSVIYPEE